MAFTENCSPVIRFNKTMFFFFFAQLRSDVVIATTSLLVILGRTFAEGKNYQVKIL
jgi:hypothetical protein